MKNRYIILLLLVIWTSRSSAQQWDWWPLAINDTIADADTVLYSASVCALVSSGEQSPFLLRANLNSNISLSPYSGNISAGLIKRASNHNRWWDYDFGVQLTGRFGIDETTGYFEQLYAHARLYVVDITAGICPIAYGSQSRMLSTGGLLFSSNAHPIPRITVGIDNYVAFPGLFGYMEIKGGLTYGWLNDHSEVQQTKLHHKLMQYLECKAMVYL